jgi:hypothetical protein
MGLAVPAAAGSTAAARGQFLDLGAGLPAGA